MLDVHVLVMSYTPPAIVRQCRESVQVAAQNAGFRVDVHFLPGIYGQLGQARARGYAMGDHPYVTHVDDDDYVHPDAFAKLLPHLQKQVTGVTTGETLVFDDGRSHEEPYSRHHLAVYARKRVEALPYQQFRFLPDQFLMKNIGAIHIPECLYFHRINAESGSRRLRTEYHAEVQKEVALIDRPDLVRIEHLSNAEIAQLYNEILDRE